MSYLKGLSRDYEITLITYEKPENWFDKDAMTRANEECSMYGIVWLPQLFRFNQNNCSYVYYSKNDIFVIARGIKK